MAGPRPAQPINAADKLRKDTEDLEKSLRELNDDVYALFKYRRDNAGNPTYQQPIKVDDPDAVLSKEIKTYHENFLQKLNELKIVDDKGVEFKLDEKNTAEKLKTDWEKFFTTLAKPEHQDAKELIKTWDTNFNAVKDNISNEFKRGAATIQAKAEAVATAIETEQKHLHDAKRAPLAHAEIKRLQKEQQELQKKAQSLDQLKQEQLNQLEQFKRDVLKKEMDHLARVFNHQRGRAFVQDVQMASGVRRWNWKKLSNNASLDPEGATLTAAGCDLLEEGDYEVKAKTEEGKTIVAKISIKDGLIQPIPLVVMPGKEFDAAWSGAIEAAINGVAAKEIKINYKNSKHVHFDQIEALVNLMEKRPEHSRLPIILNSTTIRGLHEDKLKDIFTGRTYTQEEQSERVRKLLDRLERINSGAEQSEQKRASHERRRQMQLATEDLKAHEPNRLITQFHAVADVKPLVNALEIAQTNYDNAADAAAKAAAQPALDTAQNALDAKLAEKIQLTKLRNPDGTDMKDQPRLDALKAELKSDLERLDKLERIKQELYNRATSLNFDVATKPKNIYLENEQKDLVQMFAQVEAESTDLRQRLKAWEQDLKAPAGGGLPANYPTIGTAAPAAGAAPALPAGEFDAARNDVSDALARVQRLEQSIKDEKIEAQIASASAENLAIARAAAANVRPAR